MTQSEKSRSGGVRNFISTYQSMYRGHAPTDPAQHDMASGIGRFLQWRSGFQTVHGVVLIVLSIGLAVWGFAAGWTSLAWLAVVFVAASVAITAYWHHVSGNVRKARRTL